MAEVPTTPPPKHRELDALENIVNSKIEPLGDVIGKVELVMAVTGKPQHDAARHQFAEAPRGRDRQRPETVEARRDHDHGLAPARLQRRARERAADGGEEHRDADHDLDLRVAQA